jgi:hypothetical protein
VRELHVQLRLTDELGAARRDKVGWALLAGARPSCQSASSVQAALAAWTKGVPAVEAALARSRCAAGSAAIACGSAARRLKDVKQRRRRVQVDGRAQRTRLRIGAKLRYGRADPAGVPSGDRRARDRLQPLQETLGDSTTPTCTFHRREVLVRADALAQPGRARLCAANGAPRGAAALGDALAKLRRIACWNLCATRFVELASS